MEVGTKGQLTLPIALHLHGMYIRSKVLELPIIVRGILLVSKWAARSVLPVGCKVLLRRRLGFQDLTPRLAVTSHVLIRTVPLRRIEVRNLEFFLSIQFNVISEVKTT